MSDPLGVANKVQVAEVPASEPEPKPKAPPPTKSDFPATPAQSAQALESGSLAALESGGKPNESREWDEDRVSSRDGAQRAAAEAASGKSTKAENRSTKAENRSTKAENPGTSKQEAPEALSDKPGEKQADKKRAVAEPKVHYYKEPEGNGEKEGGSRSAMRRPKDEFEPERKEASEWEYSYQKWLVPGAVAVLVLGVTIVVVSAWSKNRQPSSR